MISLLLKVQDDLSDLLSDLLSLSRKTGLEKDAQLVTVNEIVAGPNAGKVRDQPT
jgi:hypothetical protein